MDAKRDYRPPLPAVTTTEPRAPEFGEAPKSARLPFKFTIYDESGEQTIGPFWLDVPRKGAWEPVPPDFPGGHWEDIARMELWAKSQIIGGDIRCSLDTDALIGPPNERTEP